MITPSTQAISNPEKLSGKAYIKPFGSNQGWLPMGNFEDVVLTPSISEIGIDNAMSSIGGQIYSDSKIDSVELAGMLTEHNQSNLALALYGKSTKVDAGTSFEVFWIKANGSYPLQRVNGQNLIVTSVDYLPHTLTTGTQLDNDRIKWTAKNGAQPSLVISNTATNRSAIGITVAGNIITVLTKDDGTDITSTVQEVINAVASHPTASTKLSGVIVDGSIGTNLVKAVTETQLSGGAGAIYLSPTDWSKDGSTLLIPEDTTITDTETSVQIKVTEDYGETYRIDAMTGAPSPVSIYVDQINTANGQNKIERVHIHKVQFTATDSFNLIKPSEYSKLNIKGKVLYVQDIPTKNIDGVDVAQIESNYFTKEI